MITNLAVFDGGTELIHQLSKSYPEYTEVETQKKINHFLKSGTKPMTCKTICEKGYECSKYAEGNCEAKSPAGLCYLPIPTDKLVEIVEALPVTGKMIDDLQAAEAFIQNYLFNQGEVIAHGIINDNIRQHFRFGADSLRMLQAKYREIHKEQRTKANSHKIRKEKEIPEWYEVTEKRTLRFLPGVLAKVMSERQHIIYAAEQYLEYRDGVYVEISEDEVQHLVQEQLLDRESKTAYIVDAQKQWKLRVLHPIQDLNANPYIINVKNGLYDVRENVLMEHTPDYLSTIRLEVSYDSKADCPQFKKFLVDSMEGDMEQVNLIQEMLGYFLIPVNNAQKCFIIVGAADAGKSILLRVLNEILLGTKNVSNVAWQSLNERFKTAELFGKLANIFADLPTANIEDNGIFKALVGEDFLTVEKKNKNPFSFQNTARLLFSCNNIPLNYGDRSEGFYRRLIIIRFNHAVPPEKRDPEFLDKLRAETDGIFLFALKGLKRLLDNRFTFSEVEKNKSELQNYREESSSVLSFVRDCCTLYPNGKESVYSLELYKAYEKYCSDNGMVACQLKKFVNELASSCKVKKGDKDTSGRRRVLKGIQLDSMTQRQHPADTKEK
ncbi:MAG: phage/plasmid primase, P4 family [Lachnospiraceae bacterium]|nr:phage/plasmid primase, P4 family [Lachnospiraceae bacterium]